MARRGARRGRRTTDQKAAAAKAAAAAKVAAAVNEAGEPMAGPTPEQEQRAVYERKTVTTEMGVPYGFAYHRRPLFETMFTRGGNAITLDEVAALRFYRTAFDRCERSATKSCLNVGVGGGLHDPAASIISGTPSIMEAKRKVRLCESVLGAALSTVRAVALHDLSFSEIAIERFGGRRLDWIDVNEPTMLNGRPVMLNGKPVMHTVQREKIAPRSGRHRDIVRQEFLIGLRLLTRRVRDLVSMPGIEEVWIQPGKNSAVIKRGIAAPSGLYRLWGDTAQIDDLLARLRAECGDTLSFPSAPAARAALDIADNGSLSRLNNEELAA